MADRDHPELAAWLRRLGWALSPLPAKDRDDIVAEARLHVLERTDQGLPLAEALTALGPPETYARGFVDDMQLSAALGSRRWSHVLGAVAARATRSLAAAAAVLAVTAMAAVTGVLLIAVVMKIADPVHVGLWSTHSGSFYIGDIDDPAEGRELLGGWLYVLAALAVLITWQLGRLILLQAAARIARRG